MVMSIAFLGLLSSNYVLLRSPKLACPRYGAHDDPREDSKTQRSPTSVVPMSKTLSEMYIQHCHIGIWAIARTHWTFAGEVMIPSFFPYVQVASFASLQGKDIPRKLALRVSVIDEK